MFKALRLGGPAYPCRCRWGLGTTARKPVAPTPTIMAPLPEAPVAQPTTYNSITVAPDTASQTSRDARGSGGRPSRLALVAIALVCLAAAGSLSVAVRTGGGGRSAMTVVVDSAKPGTVEAGESAAAENDNHGHHRHVDDPW